MEKFRSRCNLGKLLLKDTVLKKGLKYSNGASYSNSTSQKIMCIRPLDSALKLTKKHAPLNYYKPDRVPLMLEPIFNLNDIVLIMTIGLSLILALFQPVLPVKNVVTKKLLAIFFISLTVSHICIMLIWNIYLHLSKITIALVPYFYVASLILKGTALYLYVRSITEQKFKLKRTHLIHALPIVGVFGVLALFGIDLDDMRYNNHQMPRTLELATNTVWYVIKVIPLFYFIMSVVTVFKYRNRLKEHYSEINEPALKWLYYLTLGFVLTGVWTLTISLVTFFFRYPLGITDNYLNLILIIALFVYVG
ncbi:MAG: hypothetical protein EOP48_15955 [Sphingobacteriales bacterium]|nr:MAG: hypothetical protein EOP48_15955 [Sphingobacteriales bacterium]